MKYVGGKYRQAAKIRAQILGRAGSRTEYVEPFLGGGAVAALCVPSFENARLSDIQPDLILMWQAALNGWMPPSSLSEEEYNGLRAADPSALRGFAGFGCSFGGKWWGGFGRQKTAGGKPATEQTLAPGASRSVVRGAKGMAGAVITLEDYRAVRVNSNCVVYADPPYLNTQGYAATGAFNTGEFWSVARGWCASGALVLVSELTAPCGWVKVWSKPFPSYLRGTEQVAGTRTEALFVHESQVQE